MATQDYYEVLGVPRDASPDAIKAAYRRIARETHPDLHPDDLGAHEQFKLTAEAFAVLSDPRRRLRYDDVRKPIRGIADHLIRHESGRRIIEVLLPSTSAASQRGMDLVVPVPVPSHILVDGGIATVALPQRSRCAGEERVLRIPPADRGDGIAMGWWCRLVGMGTPGRNGAPDGDCYAWCVPAITNTKRKRREG
ncbi:MAG: DnaJ domain-containing protein [bacterium]|nr:DnaJ domain-containing protein [bacterium]